MDKFKGKFRIQSTRLQNWDYSKEAMYFITICTLQREYYFGDIIKGQMQLSQMGIKVIEEWKKSIDLRPDMNLILDEYTVMPNHFHAIIGIGNNIHNNEDLAIFKQGVIKRKRSISEERYGPQYKNLSSVVRGFKSAVTMYARLNKIDFAWQTRYHDHIIRDNEEYTRIRDYIRNNPQLWERDIFNRNNSNLETINLISQTGIDKI